MRDRKHAGYTLIELAMVMGIIAVSALIVAPRMSGMINRWNLDTEINKVKVRIRAAQQSAIAEQTNYRIQFNVAGNFYIISRFDGATYVTVEVPVPQNSVRITSTAFTLSPNRVEFDQFGAPYPEGGSVTFTHSPTGTSKTMVISSVTGKIDII